MKYAINEEIKFAMEKETRKQFFEMLRLEAEYGKAFNRAMKTLKKPERVTRQMRRHSIRKAGMR